MALPRRPLIYGAALAGGLALVAVLSSSEASRMLASGGPNPGHEDIACEDCHLPAPGTARQQIQANLQELLGQRHSGASFGTLPISDEACMACHDKESDLHPVYRFEEPRFADARDILGADDCTGCHLEHSTVRVQHDLGFCETCHSDLDMTDDPIQPTHAELVLDEQWPSCMGCHDFHGNHDRVTPTDHAERIDPAVISDYLDQGSSPYGSVLVPATEPER